MSLVSCDNIGNALCEWLKKASELEIACLCENLNCAGRCEGISCAFTHMVVGAVVTVDASASTPSDSAVNIDTYDWDWGDGSPHGSGVTATHTYAEGTSYLATLTVTDDKGCQCTDKFLINVGDLCAGFDASMSISTNQNEVTVSASTVGGNPPVTYDWDWGDGSAHGTSAIGTHTYADAGSYTITLTATDDENCVATKTTPIEIASLCSYASCVFAVSGAGLEKDFLGAGVPSPGATIVSWAWDFGDSNSGTGKSTSHTYGSAGDYTVVLTMTDSEGCIATYSQEVTAEVQASCDGILASFTTSMVDDTVSVDASASTPSTGNTLTAYTWDWGDGSAAGSGVTATHTYATEGSYIIKLTVTDDTDCVDSALDEVEYSDLCTGITCQFSSESSGKVVTVTAGSNGATPVTYAWDWGDGSAAGSGASTSHTYATGGAHTITLTTTDDNGCECVTTRSVEVDPCEGIGCSFTVSKSDQTFTAVGTMTGATAPVTYDWNWGGGSAHGSGENAVHTYTGRGTRTITMTVTDANGCQCVSARMVNISSDQGGTCQCWELDEWDNFITDTGEVFSILLRVITPQPPCDFNVDKANIDWGDGTPIDTTPNINTVPGGFEIGEFTPSGVAHAYPGPGTYTLTVTIWSVDIGAQVTPGTCKYEFEVEVSEP